jgi:hypothetical protein
MTEQIKGLLEFLNTNSKVTIVIDGDHAAIRAGGEGASGIISVVDGAGKEVFQFKIDTAASLSLGGGGHSGQLILKDDKGDMSSMLVGSLLQVGSKGKNKGGRLLLFHEDNTRVIYLNSYGAELNVGAERHPGKITVFGGRQPLEANNGWFIVEDNEGRNGFQVKGAEVRVGAQGHAGDFRVIDEKGKPWLMVYPAMNSLLVGTEGKVGNIMVQHPDGSQAVSLYGEGRVFIGSDKKHAGSLTIFGGQSRTPDKSGTLTVKDELGKDVFQVNSREVRVGTKLIVNESGRDVFQVNGRELKLGAQGAGGRFSLIEGSGKEHISFDGVALRIGGEVGGSVRLRDVSGNESVEITGTTGNITVGTKGTAGSINVIDLFGNKRVNILGDSGDIELLGADCAEEFDLLAEAEPATVMVIDAEGGKLRPCDEAYDRKVAGVISGAGALSPGITLDRQGGVGRSPVALAGKVMCKVDAQYGSIEIGDLLTTSPTAGHAMRVLDPAKAFGAVIGKALKPLKAGTGLIPILIALQ